jgi:hypothetical protein
VKDTWRACRPEEKIDTQRLSKLDFGISLSRTLVDGITVASDVDGWQFETAEWSIRVRIAILDQRVAKLRSEVVTTYDTSDLRTFHFDVLAAAAAIDGCELQPSPSIGLGFSDDEVRLVVREFSDKIDRIWRFGFGFTVAGLETLSIWAIRNRTAVGVWQDISTLCTALAYGERELFRELLWEYEIGLEKRRRKEATNEATRAIHAILSSEVVKLRSMLA